MRTLVLIIALVATTVSAQSNLPACQGRDFSQWTNCFGTYTSPKGDKYVGEYRNGMANGQGTVVWPNGDKFVGESRNNFYHKGTYTFADGTKYAGEFSDGKFKGQGILIFADGSPPLEGIWENNNLVRSQRIPDHIAGRASSIAPATNSITIDSASAKCVELGFKKGTEQFGDCVLKISK